MTVDLKQLMASGVPVELKPEYRYLIFVDAECVNADDLMHATDDAPFDADVQILFVRPPAGSTVQDCVAAYELQPATK